ncbi:hypothetical protein Hanom_Chr16g01439011 [Helianthus anomalus]
MYPPPLPLSSKANPNPHERQSGERDGRQRRRSPASTRWACRIWFSDVDMTDGSALHASPAAWVLLQSRR